MDNRSWESGAAGSAPAAPASPSVGYPTAGDPQTAVPATKPGPYWFHQIGEELRAILTAAGVTPNKSTLNQLLTALRSAGVFTTAAQFNNSTLAATTEFVQRALGGFGRSFGYSTAAQTIPASQANSVINLYGTCSSITMPLSADCPVGAVICFGASSLACTINRQGTDTFFLNGTLPQATSVVMENGGDLTFVNLGAGTWALTGTSKIKYSDGFLSSLASNGYQKLPNGMIIQWGTGSTSAGGTLTQSFPIAFPNACLGQVATGVETVFQTILHYVSCGVTNNSQITVYATNNGAGLALGVRWFAVGY